MKKTPNDLRAVEAICHDCATGAGAVFTVDHISTFYEVKCGGCGKIRVCTEPRDYIWPTSNKERSQG